MSEPQVAQPNPYVLTVEPGKYAWCACGKSGNQPYCDGSHRDTGITPVIVEIEKKEIVSWCGCKKTENQPYCDGTHNSLE